LTSIVPQVFPKGEEVQSLDDVQDGYVLGTHTFWPAPPFSDMDWQVEPAGHEDEAHEGRVICVNSAVSSPNPEMLLTTKFHEHAVSPPGCALVLPAVPHC